MQLHLFSTPGEPLLQNLVNACRPLLNQQHQPKVVYLPAGAVGNLWLEFTREAFQNLATVIPIVVDQTPPSAVETALEQAALLYIPGGNTFLLKQRLQQHGLLKSVRRRLRQGLPLAAFSAGAVLCGPNILTTNDMNVCAATDFAGLALTPFNFHVHYPAQEGQERQTRDDRLWEYHAFHDNPVLALEDGAYLKISDNQTELVSGNRWRFDRNQEPVKVEIGLID
jgi:peptidase E